jgi:hypothetical protein
MGVQRCDMWGELCHPERSEDLEEMSDSNIYNTCISCSGYVCNLRELYILLL